MSPPRLSSDPLSPSNLQLSPPLPSLPGVEEVTVRRTFSQSEQLVRVGEKWGVVETAASDRQLRSLTAPQTNVLFPACNQVQIPVLPWAEGSSPSFTFEYEFILSFVTGLLTFNKV